VIDVAATVPDRFRPLWHALASPPFPRRHGHLARHDFEKKLINIHNFYYMRMYLCDCDGSIQFYELPNEVRLNDDAQRFLSSEGFIKCWPNHQDGWEPSYSWVKDCPSKG
jgi:hypothetical protein